MNEVKAKFVIVHPTGKEEVIQAKSCFVGGWVDDGSHVPFGAYVGSMNPIDSTIALTHILRAFIKLQTDEGMMTPDHAETMIKMATEDALRREKDNDPLDNVSPEEHLYKMKYQNLNKRRW